MVGSKPPGSKPQIQTCESKPTKRGGSQTCHFKPPHAEESDSDSRPGCGSLGSPSFRGVEAVPYFLVLRDGHVVERLAGDGPKERPPNGLQSSGFCFGVPFEKWASVSFWCASLKQTQNGGGTLKNAQQQVLSLTRSARREFVPCMASSQPLLVRIHATGHPTKVRFPLTWFGLMAWSSTLGSCRGTPTPTHQLEGSLGALAI